LADIRHPTSDNTLLRQAGDEADEAASHEFGRGLAAATLHESLEGVLEPVMTEAPRARIEVRLQVGASPLVELAIEEGPQLFFELPTVQRARPPQALTRW
jgi:hypothetical protein